MTTNAKAINHATILQDAKSKTGHPRTLGVITAWRCWCEMLADACEGMRMAEQQAIERGSRIHWIEYCCSPMIPAFYSDGRDLLGLLAKEALTRKISPAPFLRAKGYVGTDQGKLSDGQCNLPIEEQNQVALAVMGNCQSELEAAIMALQEPPKPTAGAVEPAIKAIDLNEKERRLTLRFNGAEEIIPLTKPQLTAVKPLVSRSPGRILLGDWRNETDTEEVYKILETLVKNHRLLKRFYHAPDGVKGRGYGLIPPQK